MTSASQLGSTQIVLQFDLSRDINGAARDVQAAINAARSQLPASLPNNPSYRKVNPSDAPIMMLALTSETVSRAQMYDVASSVLQQRIAQIDGVGQVFVGGGALPAVRVEVNPTVLNALGLGLEDLRTFLGSANANRAKGQLGAGAHSWSIATTDQLYKANEYRPLVVSYQNGAAVRLQDVGDVVDSVEDIRTGGYANGKPAVFDHRVARAWRQHHCGRGWDSSPVAHTRSFDPANDHSVGALGQNDHHSRVGPRRPGRDADLDKSRDSRGLRLPAKRKAHGHTGGRRSRVAHRHARRDVAVRLQPRQPLLDGPHNCDRIRGRRRHRRHREHLAPRRGRHASASRLRCEGAREIGFTVISISLSLVAVFIPILLMSGIVGRLFREFAVTLSIAILVSMIVSLTTTPMMCALLLTAQRHEAPGGVSRLSGNGFDWILARYEQSLGWVFRHQRATLAVTLGTMLATGYLYVRIPKGFFPQQDTGRSDRFRSRPTRAPRSRPCSSAWRGSSTSS